MPRNDSDKTRGKSGTAPTLLVGAACAALGLGCAPSGENDAPEDDPAVTEMSDPIERAQARVTRKVIDLEGVTGTALGLCDGTPCIKVYIEKNSADLRARLPKSEAGVPVVVEVTGRFRRP